MPDSFDVADEPVTDAGKITIWPDLIKLGRVRHTSNTKLFSNLSGLVLDDVEVAFHGFADVIVGGGAEGLCCPL